MKFFLIKTLENKLKMKFTYVNLINIKKIDYDFGNKHIQINFLNQAIEGFLSNERFDEISDFLLNDIKIIDVRIYDQRQFKELDGKFENI